MPPLPKALEGNDFLIHFAQIHETFRKAELEALAQLHGIPLEWKEYSDSSPFAIVSLPSATAAQKLIARSILAKGIYTLWAWSDTYYGLHTSLQSRLQQLVQPCMNHTFKFTVETFQSRRSARSQRELIESFAYMGFNGEISMKTPDLHFFIFEEFPDRQTMSRVFFGIKISDGGRDAVATYDLKKRSYIGTTSMDAELSLVTANMAHAAPGRLVYDPFVGTGSFLYGSAHFGATTIGSDIDGRQIRGKKGRSVLGNFKQYGLVSRYLDGFTSDLTNTPLRRTRFLDAVICDPPYGVREGLKVLGSRDPAKEKEPVMVGGVMGHLRPEYIPPKKPYGFLAMLDDILRFSADHLVEGGRLAFWMPTANDEFQEELDIPSHPQLDLVAVCVQEFNKWSRRLLVYSRRSDDDISAEEAEMLQRAAIAEDKKMTADELNGFRKKYFEGFKSSPIPPKII
ncbi:tRNA guanosine-2'-O-methyltransferase [Wilcoxina mikolae CBS 423.85]|nr:tRNA guanosine-2'-O-methyltransferase [Wilcoxina mikolae CBS 423.85]